MCTNWMRFTLKAIMLASLSLFIFGCSGSETETQALKEIRGVVSDSSGGKPFANASVTAYAVDAAGKVSTTPLSATVRSDGQGNFILKIPESYTGGIKFVATETTGSQTVTIRSVLPSVSKGQIVVISPATEVVYQYVIANKGGIFTPANIQKAILALEPFFGQNFTQIPPPAIGSAPTPAQQQLLVVIQAINSLVKPGTTIADLVKFAPDTTTIALGVGTLFEELKDLLASTNTALINQGVVTPGSYTPPTTSPAIPEPDLTDVVPPSAPQNLTATSTPDSVTLAWGVATDPGGSVLAYYVYRNNVFIKVVDASALTFTDAPLDPSTTYIYEVTARDAAGNISAGATKTISTISFPTYTISGRITSNGVGLPSVFVVISGLGTGVFTTDADGNYVIPGVRKGEYAITPAASSYSFVPASRSVIVDTANVSGVDFTAVDNGSVTGGVSYPPGTIIGGISYPSGIVIGGVTYPAGTIVGGVTYSSGTVNAGVTYPDGAATAVAAYPSGTIIGGITYPNGAVVGSIVYPTSSVTASLAFRLSISGNVAGGAGVTVGLSGSGTDSTTADADGNYTFTNVVNGTYTITPTGYTAVQITVNNDNMPGVNF